MAKICINGIIREMTMDEAEELYRQMAEIHDQPKTELEQRIAALEELIRGTIKE